MASTVASLAQDRGDLWDTGRVHGPINLSIQQLNHVIQQNAGAAEEISSTSQELSSQADELLKTISFFKINGNGGTTGPALPPSPTKVRALDHEKTVRPSQTRPEMAHAHAGSRAEGVHLDLGPHGGGNGKNRKNGDCRDAEFEEF